MLTRASLKHDEDSGRCASRAWTMTSALPGICEPSAGSVTAAHGGTLGGHILLLELVPERNFAIGIRNQCQRRLAADPGRRARSAEVVSGRDLPEEPRASRIADWLRHCRVEPLATQPDPVLYIGRYLRPMNAVVGPRRESSAAGAGPTQLRCCATGDADRRSTASIAPSC